MRERRRRQRVLAIDPTTFGCCYAILENDRGLVDWGGKRVEVKGKNTHTIAAALALIRTYRPDVLVLEDCQATDSRRCARVQTLIQHLEGAGRGQKVPVAFVTPRALRRTCTGNPSATKHDVAVAVAKRFPELARWLPPKRKLWMSEHWRTGVFDAVALAVTALEGKRSGGRRPSTRGDP